MGSWIAGDFDVGRYKFLKVYMVRNFIVIAWRNLVRKKSFSIINIAGLAIGMTVAILILLWIEQEVNFDQFHVKKDRIYEVWNRYKTDGITNCWANTPKVMARAIQEDFPEVEQTTRISFLPPVQIAYGEKRIDGRGRVVDSTFLQIFSFPVIRGSLHNSLNDAYSIALTERLAKKIFGTEDPMGKIIRIDNADNLRVTAILKDPPPNSRFEFSFLLGWSYLRYKQMDEIYWSNNSVETFVLLKKSASLANISPKIRFLRKQYDKEDPLMETFLYPFGRLHLHGWFVNGVETGGKIVTVRLFGIIAGFVLLIACINFMNLSTASSERRAKEVGIRKVIGARKRALLFQFLGESIFISLIAGLFALLLAQLCLPVFNELAGKSISIDFSNGQFILSALTFVLFTGLLAGSYPAFFLSSFMPIRVLKGNLKAGQNLVTPRKILVITQFTFAIVLIIATFVIRQQIGVGQSRATGYSRNNLVYHFMEGQVEKNYPLIKEELLNSGVAVSVSKTSAPITEGWSNSWSIGWEGKKPDDKTVINQFCADDAIAKTTGMQIIQGRDLNLKEFPTDSLGALLNESAVKVMGFHHPLGEVIRDMGQEWHVVGVVKDFILNSPYQPMEPMFIAGAKGWFNVIHIKLNDQQPMQSNIDQLKSIFRKYNPGYELNYRFVDEEYTRKFEDEKRIGRLGSWFTLLTILISCLGLFGLSTYMAENRIKEIGVRKVLGASVSSITALLSKEFVKLVLISLIIASPIAYWAMSRWLMEFPYRTPLYWWVFVLAGLSAMVIALLTVSFQAIRAARRNPVKSLRTD